MSTSGSFGTVSPLALAAEAAGPLVLAVSSGASSSPSSSSSSSSSSSPTPFSPASLPFSFTCSSPSSSSAGAAAVLRFLVAGGPKDTSYQLEFPGEWVCVGGRPKS